MDHFISAIESSMRVARPLESSTPTVCWLSVLIGMQVISAAEALDSAADPARNGDDQRLSEWCRLCSSLDSSRRETTRIQKRNAGIQRSDYALAFSRLEHLLKEVRSQKRDLNEQLNNQFRTKSIDAAESIVREGRNAVSCESSTSPEFRVEKPNSSDDITK